MSTRRDLILGAGCLATLAGAEALRPRRRLTLLTGATLDQVAPQTVGAWTARDVGNLVAPVEGSLAAKLYGQLVERVYTDAATGRELMVLLAYGDTQSNDLQLHRPETCYPAFGFRLTASRPANLRLSPAAVLPARALVAESPGRRECIVYWTRLGDFLPVDDKEQGLARLRTALSGYVADGVLARFSVLADDPAAGVAAASAFIPPFVRAIAAAHRPALIGSTLSRLMAGA